MSCAHPHFGSCLALYLNVHSYLHISYYEACYDGAYDAFSGLIKPQASQMKVRLGAGVGLDQFLVLA